MNAVNSARQWENGKLDWKERKREEGKEEGGGKSGGGKRERKEWRGRGRKREEGEGKAEGKGGEYGSHQSEQAAPEQGQRVQRVQQPHPTGGQLGADCAGGTRTSRVQLRLPLPVPPAERWAGTLWGLSAPGRAFLAA